MLAALVLLVCALLSPVTPPPYHGTIFIAPEIFLDDDPTSFTGLTFEGRGEAKQFDRRTNAWETNNAWQFSASFADGLSLTVRVNPEFDQTRAEELARFYMKALGQLPTGLRQGLVSFDIHDGDELFGGGGRNVLVHHLQGEKYVESGILVETLFHETVHATIDQKWATEPSWIEAQRQDAAFLSNYGRDHPTREDLAESLLLCFGVSERPDRLPVGTEWAVRETIPARLAWFEKQLAWKPVTPPPTSRPAE